MTMHGIIVTALSVGVIGAGGSAFAQAPVTVPADADTTVRIEWDGSANTNWGCEPVAMIGTGR